MVKFAGKLLLLHLSGFFWFCNLSIHCNVDVATMQAIENARTYLRLALHPHMSREKEEKGKVP